MKTLDVLALRFGRVASEPLSDADEQFYAHLSHDLLGYHHQLLLNPARTTVAIDTMTFNQHPADIYPRIIDAADKLDRRADTIIIDMANQGDVILRGVVDIHLGAALSQVMSVLKESTQTLIFLLSKLPAAGDALLAVVESAMRNKRVLLLANDGTIAPPDYSSPYFNPHKYRVDFAHTRGDPLELLKSLSENPCSS